MGELVRETRLRLYIEEPPIGGKKGSKALQSQFQAPIRAIYEKSVSPDTGRTVSCLTLEHLFYIMKSR